MKTIQNIFFSLMFLFASYAGHAAVTSVGKNQAQIAAVVNEETILASELDSRIRMVIASGHLQNSPEVREQLKEQILKLMIDEALQLEIAAKYELEVTEEELDHALRRIESTNNMAKGELEKFLVKHKIPKHVLTQQIKAGIVWQRYINERYQTLIQVTDQDIQKVLDKLEANKGTDHVLLAEIVLPVDGPNDEETVKQQSTKLVKQLQNGAHFSLIAQQFSRSASSAQGGDIGWVPLNQLDASLQHELASMTPGGISKPVRTEDGYHIILLRDHRDAGSQGPTETVVSFQQVLFPFSKSVSKSEAESMYRKAQSISRNAKSCEMLEQLAKGVALVKSKMVNDVRLKDLHPQLRSLLKKLAVRESSPPIMSEMGIFLFMVDKKQDVKLDDLSKDDVFRQLVDKKLMQIGRRELRNLRRAAFIDIRV